MSQFTIPDYSLSLQGIHSKNLRQILTSYPQSRKERVVHLLACDTHTHTWFRNLFTRNGAAHSEQSLPVSVNLDSSPLTSTKAT